MFCIVLYSPVFTSHFTMLMLVDYFSYEVTSHRDGVRRPKVVTYWLGKLRNPGNTEVTLSDEHQDFKWLEIDAACKMAKFENMKKALRRCQERIAAPV